MLSAAPGAEASCFCFPACHGRRARACHPFATLWQALSPEGAKDLLLQFSAPNPLSMVDTHALVVLAAGGARRCASRAHWEREELILPGICHVSRGSRSGGAIPSCGGMPVVTTRRLDHAAFPTNAHDVRIAVELRCRSPPSTPFTSAYSKSPREKRESHRVHGPDFDRFGTRS